MFIKSWLQYQHPHIAKLQKLKKERNKLGLPSHKIKLSDPNWPRSTHTNSQYNWTSLLWEIFLVSCRCFVNIRQSSLYRGSILLAVTCYMKNVSTPWLTVLLFQTMYTNKIPIQSKELGSPLVAEQVAYCSACLFGAWIYGDQTVYSWLCFRRWKMKARGIIGFWRTQ